MLLPMIGLCTGLARVPANPTPSMSSFSAGLALLPPSATPALRSAARRRASRVRMDEDPCVDEICDPLEEVTREEAREALSTLTTPNSAYAEESRKYRRSVYMHNEWVRHRSSDRFYTNLATISKSGVGIALRNELILVSGVALFVILANCLFVSYHDFAGIEQPGPLSAYWFEGPWSLPSLPFTIAMPALSLLLVFRTNTAYSRWNEARTLWGGVVNNCRNIVRQSNTFYATDERGVLLRDRMVGNTIAFCKALRNFLRGPTDDRVFERELRELADAGLIPRTQVRRCMQVRTSLGLAYCRTWADGPPSQAPYRVHATPRVAS